jgi:dolichol kinase
MSRSDGGENMENDGLNTSARQGSNDRRPAAPERRRATREEIIIEITRKSIHLVIAVVPTLLYFSRPLTIFLLSAGTLLYAILESLRRKGINIPLVSRLTSQAARLRDAGRFVKGPITLGLGALLSVLLFPTLEASIAVYILAFGDSFSSLVGKTIGRIRMPFTRGKSLEGSLTCFVAAFVPTFVMSASPGKSLVIALGATLVEALPTKDWDNILLPLASGALALLLAL